MPSDTQKTARALIPNGTTRIALSAFSGLLLVACFPKFHLPGAVWIACLPLLLALSQERSLKRAFLLGYVSGAVFLAGSCYWFVGVMESYGHVAAWQAWGAFAAFLAVFSLFIGSFGVLVGWCARRYPIRGLALAPFLWVAMELARTYLLSGFPWNLLGYGVQAAGIRQVASATGVYGLSFLAVATSSWVAALLVLPRSRGLVFCGAASILVLVLGNFFLAPRGTIYAPYDAYLVQPNVPLDDEGISRWEPWVHGEPLEHLVAISIVGPVQFAQACAALAEVHRPATLPEENPAGKGLDRCGVPPYIIWAENPAPFYFTRDPIFRNAVEGMARQARAFSIVNTVIPVDAAGKQITNSAIVLNPEGHEIARYDKIHLVPFGEYVPAWGFPGLVNKITPEVGNFVAGTQYEVAKTSAGSLGVLICYEAIFPQLARKLTAAGAGVLVNISNDGWYGESAAAYQHLEMARLRAIENHRYLLRATNDGVTTVIDPYGRLGPQLSRNQQGVLAVKFGFETRKTFYTAYGDLFAWVCGIAAALILLRSYS